MIHPLVCESFGALPCGLLEDSRSVFVGHCLDKAFAGHVTHIGALPPLPCVGSRLL